jgi:hypothetical protein
VSFFGFDGYGGVVRSVWLFGSVLVLLEFHSSSKLVSLTRPSKCSTKGPNQIAAISASTTNHLVGILVH